MVRFLVAVVALVVAVVSLHQIATQGMSLSVVFYLVGAVVFITVLEGWELRLVRFLKAMMTAREPSKAPVFLVIRIYDR